MTDVDSYAAVKPYDHAWYYRLNDVL